MPSTALARVDVPVPEWAVVDLARRRADTLRSCCGRVATVAGFAAAAVGMFTSAFTGWSLAGTAALTIGGVLTLRAWKPDSHQKSAATWLYLTPGAGLAALLLLERMLSGVSWVEALGLAVWTVGTVVVRPAREARYMLIPRPSPAPRTSAPTGEGSAPARWWAAHVAVEGGAAPGTALEAVESTGEGSVRALIRSTMPGQPVPDVNIRALSALMDVPEDTISVTPEPGRGASVRRLTIGRPAADDPATVWTQQIAPAAMPGAVLTGVRVGRPGTEDA
jgi:hypothetical protein